MPGARNSALAFLPRRQLPRLYVRAGEFAPDIGRCIHEFTLERKRRASVRRAKRIVRAGAAAYRRPANIYRFDYIMVPGTARTTVVATFERASFDARMKRE